METESVPKLVGRCTRIEAFLMRSRINGNAQNYPTGYRMDMPEAFLMRSRINGNSVSSFTPSLAGYIEAFLMRSRINGNYRLLQDYQLHPSRGFSYEKSN